MQTKDLRALVRFDEGEARRETLLESERLWAQVVCLDRAQRLGPISDEASDAVCVVLAGKIAAQVDKGRARMDQWETLLVPAGAQLTLANASEDPSVVLMVAAPSPQR